MKKVTAVAGCILLICLFISCRGRHHNGSLNISVSENGNSLKIDADFDESKDRTVEECLNDHLGSNSNMSFSNSRIDGDITLDDKTTFYIRKKPGVLVIKLDKDKNSRSSYIAMKEFGTELKSALQK